MPGLTGLAPVLLVPDVGATLAHYRDVLGFETEAYSQEPEDYGYAHRDECTVHLARGEVARPNAEVVPPDLFDVYFWTNDVAGLYDELRGRGADLLHEPIDRPWQMREIRVRDVNGYVLGFGELLRED